MNRKKMIIILVIFQLLLLTLLLYLLLCPTNTSTHEQIDKIPPQIELKGEKIITIPIGTSYQDEGCIATDNQEGDITNRVRITGKVDTMSVGEYWIQYQVLDKNQNKATYQRKVIVKETAAESSNPLQTTSSERGIPVLMYHFFYDDKIGEKGKDNNWISITKFEKQMKYLSDNQFYFPSWKELEEFIDSSTIS